MRERLNESLRVEGSAPISNFRDTFVLSFWKCNCGVIRKKLDFEGFNISALRCECEGDERTFVRRVFPASFVVSRERNGKSCTLLTSLQINEFERDVGNGRVITVVSRKRDETIMIGRNDSY